MWTPKRIVILCACFLAFFTVYLGYAYTFVGRIDGLPPLPQAYYFENQESVPIAVRPRRSDKLTEKLRLAFGASSPELKWPIQLDVLSRGLVIAAGQFDISKDGRVCLTPLSIAVVGKEKNDGLPLEIHTIRGEVAYLKFDRPVTNFSEIASRKIMQAEITGRIEVVSNRRRAERDQDLRVTVPTGTLYYDESTHHIYTEAYVTLEDHKSKPHPHKITGKGMEIELQTEAQAPKPTAKKANRETISGLNWIALASAVTMDLYLEGSGGLVASKPAEKPAEAKASPQARSHLRIETPGCFRYDLKKDHDLARFDVAPAGQQGKPRSGPQRVPEHVTVNRTNLLNGVTDHLVCQHLALRLKRREAAKEKKPGGDSAVEGIQIETIHATAPPGKSVVLESNADHVGARGLDFFHDAIRELTILKGLVEVDKDESKMHAREVRIQNVYPPGTAPRKPGQPAPKPHQHITAQGPGDILFVDKKEGKTLRANWQEVLTSTREGAQDLLVLTGNASFYDQQADQKLSGDVLKVWLEEATAKAATGAAADSRRPRHLEATGHVEAKSRDLVVHDTGRLVVWFKDAESPVAQMPPPRSGPVKATQVPASEPYSPELPRPLPPGPAKLTSRPASGPELPSANKADPPRPFDLSARSVAAMVLRAPNGTALEQVWCEGNVHVQQDPSKPGEKGTEVKGETLEMTSTGDNNYKLIVHGDMAQLWTDKIYIVGPEVTIDQATNRAWVDGDGAMKMDSETNFQGEPLEKPVPLDVHWSKRMLFNGESAEFFGNIQATQEKARLACQRLQVYFTKPISLKNGNKTTEQARVRNLVCDREVRIEDTAFENERLVKYQRLEAPCVSMNALDPTSTSAKPTAGARVKGGGNLVQAYGPGTIRIWQPGSAEDPLGPQQAVPRGTSAKAASPPSQMRMTYVSFASRMDANSRKNTAQFWGGGGMVKVLHMPWPRHDAPFNLDEILAINELPENALFVRCEELKVLDAVEAGKPNKQMEAHKQVYIQGKDFWARADSMYYNELKQQIILEGKDGGNAILQQSERRGDKPRTIEGKKLIYNRATGEINGQGVTSVSGETRPGGGK